MKKYVSVNHEQYPPVYAVQVTTDNSGEVKEWVRGSRWKVSNPAPLVCSLFGVQTYNCVTQVKEGDFVVWVDDWYFQVMSEVEFFKRYRDADKEPPDEVTQLRDALVELLDAVGLDSEWREFGIYFGRISEIRRLAEKKCSSTYNLLINMKDPTDSDELPSVQTTVVEVRLCGKLLDLHLEGPEHAVRNSLQLGGPYQEVRVVENPHGYDFSFLDAMITPERKTS